MDYLYDLLDSEELYKIPNNIKNRFAKLTLSKKKKIRRSIQASLKESQNSQVSKNLLQELLTDDSSESEADEINRIFLSSSKNSKASSNQDKLIDESEIGQTTSTRKSNTRLEGLALSDSDETQFSINDKKDSPKAGPSKYNYNESDDFTNKTVDMEKLQFSESEGIAVENLKTLESKHTQDNTMDFLSQQVSSLGIRSPKHADKSVEKTQIVSVESERKSSAGTENIVKLLKTELNYRNETVLTVSSDNSPVNKTHVESEEFYSSTEDSVISISDSDEDQPPLKSENFEDHISDIRASGQTNLASTMSNAKADRLEQFLNDLPLPGQENYSYYQHDESFAVKSTDESLHESVLHEDSVEIAETSSEHEDNKLISEKLKSQNEYPSMEHDTPNAEDDSPLVQGIENNNKSTEKSSSPASSSSSSDSGIEQISISAKINIKIQITQPYANINRNETESTMQNESSPQIQETRESLHYQEHQKAITAKSIVENIPVLQNDDISLDDVDDKAKEILTKLYGNSWQTPEIIRKLDRKTNSPANKSGNQLLQHTNSPIILHETPPRINILANNTIQNKVLASNDFLISTSQNHGRITDSPKQNINNQSECTTSNNKTNDESSLADFSTFHKNIKKDLESTRLNNRSIKQVAKPFEEFKKPLSERKYKKQKAKIEDNKITQSVKATKSGRTIKAHRYHKIANDNSSEDEEDAFGGCNSDNSWSGSSSSSSSFSESEGTSKKDIPRKGTRTRTKKKSTNNDLIYLDLSSEVVKIQKDICSSPPANHDIKFDENLKDILKTCTFNKKQIEATPIQGKTKRKLFTPCHGNEEEVLPPESPLRNLDINNSDEIHLSMPIPILFETPINKKLESIKTGTPIFKIPTPTLKKLGSPLFKGDNEINQHKTPKTPKTPNTPKTPKTPKSSGRPKKNIFRQEEISENGSKNKYGFLKSLDVMVSKSLCHPDALIYRDNYKTKKEELAQRLYNLYNEKLFNNDLTVPITWNKKLTNTAGRCSNKKKGNNRSSVIELSEKVLTSADRLRCTLIHELCHAATWVFNGEHGHGATWKTWAKKANFIFQELPIIGVCHAYDIEYKYTYKCMLCNAKSHAHSKSKKVENIRCAYCHGAIEIYLNKKDKEGNLVSTPVKEPTGFAKFVQEKYKTFKRPELKHAEVMKLLGSEFAALKVQEKY